MSSIEILSPLITSVKELLKERAPVVFFVSFSLILFGVLGMFSVFSDPNVSDATKLILNAGLSLVASFLLYQIFKRYEIERTLKKITDNDRNLIHELKKSQRRDFSISKNRHDLIAIAEKFVDFGIARRRPGTNKEASYEIFKEYFHHKKFN